MDDILRQAFPTRRTARCGPHLSFKEDAAWANSLDWQTNEYDFHRLFRSLVIRLDSHYRESGLRLDQLAHQEELYSTARRAASWYRQADPHYHTATIYEYLYRELDQLLSKRARTVWI